MPTTSRKPTRPAKTYLPDGMAEQGWYAPTPRGLEGKIGEKLAHLRDLDRKAKGRNSDANGASIIELAFSFLLR